MQYLMTLEALFAAAVANLGPMDMGTFAEFKSRASVEATKLGIRNPRLVIDIKLKQASDFGSTEQPYPISAGSGTSLSVTPEPWPCTCPGFSSWMETSSPRLSERASQSPRYKT